MLIMYQTLVKKYGSKKEESKRQKERKKEIISNLG